MCCAECKDSATTPDRISKTNFMVWDEKHNRWKEDQSIKVISKFTGEGQQSRVRLPSESHTIHEPVYDASKTYSDHLRLVEYSWKQRSQRSYWLTGVPRNPQATCIDMLQRCSSPYFWGYVSYDII